MHVSQYSGILIEKMRRKHEQARPGMECKNEIWLSRLCHLISVAGHEMDVRDLKFDAESFDVAIDKGTMDAMMTAKADVWVRPRYVPHDPQNAHQLHQDPPEEVIENCTREVNEVLRYIPSPSETCSC